MELQAALQASLMGTAAYGRADPDPPYPAPVAAASRDPIFGSGTRTPVGRRGYGVQVQVRDEDEGEDEDDVDTMFDEPAGANRYASLAPESDPLAASRARSQAYMEQVRRQQEAALRESYQEEAARMAAGIGRRRDTRAEQEEAELLAAIEESRAMHEAMGRGPAPQRDEEDGNSQEPARQSPPSGMFGADRVYDDEDAELQAALRASLEGLPEGFQIPPTPPRAAPRTLPLPTTRTSVQAPDTPDQADEDDEYAESEAESSVAMEEAPQLSMEEMRRKRLAKFGG